MTRHRHTRLAAAPRRFPLCLLALGLLWAAAPGCSRGPSVVLEGAGGQAIRVRVEIANTPETRAQGLMYRRTLAPDAGMLFLFPETQPLRFWMKNTLIPLDMIFIDGDRRVVGIVANARPLTTEGRGVAAPSRYVLEVNGGFAAAHGIAAGARVEFEAVPLQAR